MKKNTKQSRKATETKIININPEQALREELESRVELLKDFTSVFDLGSDYMGLVDAFNTYGAKLQLQGLEAFSEEELTDFVFCLQDFQNYSAAWQKALRPFGKTLERRLEQRLAA